MKRAFLIAGGTVGGLGAVLAITPPQLGSSGSLAISGGMSGSETSAIASASSNASSTSNAGALGAAAAPSTVATKPTKKSGAATSTTTTPTKAAANAQTTAAAPATTAATPATTAATTGKASINGTFTGPAVFVQYGNMQVRITVVNGRITDAVAVQNPGQGRNARYTNMALPELKQQTLAAQSANIQGVSGASYTAYGWFKSLQGALADAGL